MIYIGTNRRQVQDCSTIVGTVDNPYSSFTSSSTSSGSSVLVSAAPLSQTSAMPLLPTLQPPVQLPEPKHVSTEWRGCVVCELDPTWAFVLHSEATRAHVTHNCRSLAVYHITHTTTAHSLNHSSHVLCTDTFLP